MGRTNRLITPKAISQVSEPPAQCCDSPGLSFDELAQQRASVRRFWFMAAACCLLYALPLVNWCRFAISSGLYSHVILIPYIGAYLIWSQEGLSKTVRTEPAWRGLGFLGAGILLLFMYYYAIAIGSNLKYGDIHCIGILGFLSFMLGLGLVNFGSDLLSRLTPPLAFFLFMLPFPHAIETALEAMFQYGSAEVFNVLIKLSETPVLRNGSVFVLPGLSIEVARECSGIRSSWVLFITSIIAGQLFLRRPINKALIAGLVIPISLIRNGFRVFTLVILTLHVDPAIINSPLHSRGGPLFFILSLGPLLGAMWVLRRIECAAKAREIRMAAGERVAK